MLCHGGRVVVIEAVIGMKVKVVEKREKAE